MILKGKIGGIKFISKKEAWKRAIAAQKAGTFSKGKK